MGHCYYCRAVRMIPSCDLLTTKRKKKVDKIVRKRYRNVVKRKCRLHMLNTKAHTYFDYWCCQYSHGNTAFLLVRKWFIWNLKLLLQLANTGLNLRLLNSGFWLAKSESVTVSIVTLFFFWGMSINRYERCIQCQCFVTFFVNFRMFYKIFLLLFFLVKLKETNMGVIFFYYLNHLTFQTWYATWPCFLTAQGITLNRNPSDGIYS